MLLKKLSIPLIDFRLQTSENFKPLDLNSGVYQIKLEKNEEKGGNSEKAVKKPEESYLRCSSRQRKVVKSMKEESSDKSDESPSSEEDNGKEDPDFDSEEEDETIRKKKEMKRKNKVTKFVKKEPMSAYELMIQKNREEKMAFLKSLQIDEAKTAFSEIVRDATGRKVQPVKRKYAKVERPTILRKSKRMENVKRDMSEETLFKNACNKLEVFLEKPKQVMPPKMTFKEAFAACFSTSFKEALEEAEDCYESFKVDVAIQEESEPDVIPLSMYDKPVLGKMSVREQHIAKVTPARINALTWYPTPENLIIAAGDVQGQLGIWNIESENPHLFKIHFKAVSHLQFNPYNQTQLISSSLDGTLRCGDMVKHQFSELYNISDNTACTYFDVLSATAYLVGQKDGKVALVDKRTRNNSCQMKHVCHDYFIRTVNIHPTDNNFFLTAGNEGFCVWDLRKLNSTPVAHHITPLKSCVNSAFFSPVTGNSILSVSNDCSISMFYSKDLTSVFELRTIRMVKKGRCCINRTTWLPNSDELFSLRSLHYPRIEVYDKNLSAYYYMYDPNLKLIAANAFHPTRPALAGSNSSGNVFAFV